METNEVDAAEDDCEIGITMSAIVPDHELCQGDRQAPPSRIKGEPEDSLEKAEPVTVFIILHGDPPSINRTLASLQNQTYWPEKITIVCLDDGTSPAALALLEKQGVQVVRLPDGCNISYAKNYAMHNCTNDLVFFLDDRMILRDDAIEQIMKALQRMPFIAGVCGHYECAESSDLNTLRDIKRETLYGKNCHERLITLDDFTTFSTGIAVMRRSLVGHFQYPEDFFPNNFGGEDVPMLIAALNQGLQFAYVPAVRATHEHNLSWRDFVRKTETEVRGRFSLLYWASNHPNYTVPYLYGFLSLPYFFCWSLLLAMVMGFFWPLLWVLPVITLGWELRLSLSCLRPGTGVGWRNRAASAAFVFISDILSLLCAAQYAVSDYKRPYKRLTWRQRLRIHSIFLRWELKKYRVC
jgi:cellulose synthase/poly-beta-1,6-N-acetylglucosamine synthase-like glycosyltransferase